MTADLDLVIALDAANVRAAADALRSLGYRPRAPVSLDDFADPELRRSWIDEKGMTVLSLASPELPLTEVDLFAAEPFPFEPAYQRALTVSIGATRVTAASFEDLVGSSAWLAGRRISRMSKPSKRFGARATETGRRRAVRGPSR